MGKTYDIFESAPLCSGWEFTAEQETTIRDAIGILESMFRATEVFTSPGAVKEYCRLKIAHKKDEYFCCLFLDSKHRLISFERLFRGTIDGASVHPRVVVRRALELNAAATIFTHNHPSGVSEPSSADIRITSKLKEALALVDTRVLDHIVVGLSDATSLAEAGHL
jgi:DNA repair protein RadC